MKKSPALPLSSRATACKVLNAVFTERRPLADALALADRLPAIDRAFVQRLVLTVLRRHGQVDALLDRFLKQPLQASPALVQQALRLGVVQLAYLGTPPHAAVYDTVEALEELKLSAFKGLANAVLRKVMAHHANALEEISTHLNTPEWLWNAWVSDYGATTANAIADAHLDDAPTDLSAVGAPEELADAVQGIVLPTGSVRLAEAGAIPSLAGYAEGTFWVQDAAASLPVLLMGNVRGKRVLDLCAAPGGKTAQLAAAGAIVTAVDRSAKRLERVKQNLARLNLSAEVICADASTWQPETPIDTILLDAPCTALGTIRRHPDVAILKTPRDVADMVALQQTILEQALRILPVGGVLVYCVCSLLHEEGEQQMAALLQSHPEMRRVPFTAEEVRGYTEWLTPEGDVRTLPCHLPAAGGMDGFFISRVAKEG